MDQEQALSISPGVEDMELLLSGRCAFVTTSLGPPGVIRWRVLSGGMRRRTYEKELDGRVYHGFFGRDSAVWLWGCEKTE